MKLPRSISPCPICEAVAEVRFESTTPADAVFGIVYQALRDEFPSAEDLLPGLPPQFRNADKDLSFQPHYRLVNDRMTILIGPKVVAAGMRGEYPGWSVLAPRIKKVFGQLIDTGIVRQPTRLGLRFISFFPFDVFPKLRLRISVDDEPWDGQETHFKTILKRPGHHLLVQVGKDLALLGKPTVAGSVIDIDSFTMDIQNDFPSRLQEFLEAAHESEKELFFRLLKPEFLESLNPVY
ncbi:MAG: TIGR04255 family protein [Verrucomicrobiota bacterium]|jgi:uncharacterized protein (TIGR04255 family)